MRSVGSTAAVFFWESFISELAHRAGIDQYAYRRELLAANPLALRVLDAVAEAAQWKSPPTSGGVRGISYNCYVGRGGRFRTYVAQVVELTPAGDRLAVKRVFCAVDPGLAVNPNTLTAQIQGGIGFAMTTALLSRITFANGGAEQSNFLDYPLLAIDGMPEIVPIILPSDRPPQGFGEVVLAPLAPAIAQALLQATGRRIDSMPLPAEAFGDRREIHPAHQRPTRQVEVDGDTPLLWVLREELGLTGHQVRLRRGVLRRLHRPDGRRAGAFLLAAVSDVGRGAGHDHRGHRRTASEAVQRAWIAGDVPQCGYCQSGQIMGAIAL